VLIESLLSVVFMQNPAPKIRKETVELSFAQPEEGSLTSHTLVNDGGALQAISQKGEGEGWTQFKTS